ncbi:unnamed protein product [Darwinula stevensoni]|uniref:Uncharacterized protein n=1 Tax=Darwinula stevensoni TaxID=69355 RepID=A0A7R9A246_9CRUS|nr:unnamed protein product [Darwinula stevensoni]CAG0887938.1 unnamed protein product [Darwinula stevensoni]
MNESSFTEGGPLRIRNETLTSVLHERRATSLSRFPSRPKSDGRQQAPHLFPLTGRGISRDHIDLHDQTDKSVSLAFPSPRVLRTVLHDVILAMLEETTMDEYMKPRAPHSKPVLKALFTRLANSSIMKLNENSMNKLYDLMTMVVTYQMSQCTFGTEMLWVTVNHIRGIRECVSLPAVAKVVDQAHHKFIQVYTRKSQWELELIRKNVLNYFQDLKIRVSIFLKEGKQLSNGQFVHSASGLPPGGSIDPALGVETPGVIRCYEKGVLTGIEEFKGPGIPEKGDETLRIPLGSLLLDDEPGTELGLDIYTKQEKADENERAPDATSPNAPTDAPPELPDDLAGKELDVLAQLLGKRESGKEKVPEFRLSLFATDLEEREYVRELAEVRRQEEDHRSARTRDAELQRVIDEISVSEEPSAGVSTREEFLQVLDLQE